MVVMAELEKIEAPQVMEKTASFESVGVDSPSPNAATCTELAFVALVELPITMESATFATPVAGIVALTFPRVTRTPSTTVTNQYSKGMLGAPPTTALNGNVTGHFACG
jgi:hypothetical protein